MINAEHGIVKVKGSRVELLADFATVVNSLHHELEISKEDLEDTFSRGLMNESEIKNKLINILAEKLAESFLEDWGDE